MSKDLVALAEQVYACVSSDGVRAEPNNPCTSCGRESVEHSPDPETMAPRMICCFDDCRAVRFGTPRR
jgi:hypothetical protein